MSKDLIAIIGVGISLAGLILYSQHSLSSEMLDLRQETRAEFKVVRSEMKAEFNIHLETINRLRDDVSQLQERMARQEGLMEGLLDAITGSRELVAGPSG